MGGTRIRQLFRRSPPHSVPARIDRRVRAIVEILQIEPARKSTLAELAQSARLSESHLAHLFHRDVGVPMRQYRLTLRAVQAVQEIALGVTSVGQPIVPASPALIGSRPAPRRSGRNSICSHRRLIAGYWSWSLAAAVTDWYSVLSSLNTSVIGTPCSW